MDSIQKQVVTLSHKVDALYQIIEQLSGKISDVLSEKNCKPNHAVQTESVYSTNKRYISPYHSRLDLVMEHKDVLVDGHTLELNSQSIEQELTPEIQIQRLTAQLTAAYNRIAVLEEQLLAQRIH